MDYLLGLLRLIHSHCQEFRFHIKKSLHFSSQILSETAEGSIPQPGWEAGVFPPLLPFPGRLLLCLGCLGVLRNQQSHAAWSSSLVMALGVPGLLSPRRIHRFLRWVLGSVGNHRAPQLLPTAPFPASAVFLGLPTAHTSGREESWRCLAWAKLRAHGQLSIASLRAWPALGRTLHPASRQTSSFLPTQPDQTALRKQSGIHISPGCRRQSSVAGRGSCASSTFQLTTAGSAPLRAAASAAAPLHRLALCKALFWLGTSLLSFLVLKSHTETFPLPMACDPANSQAHIPNVKNNNFFKKRGRKKRKKWG